MKIEESSYYHVYNRGNNKELIFFQENDYIHFLDHFIKYVKPFIEVYAYCLMSNHFHFFLRIKDKAGFEKGIKNFFISYVKHINFKYERVGSLFQGRYKVSRITSDSYFTRVITYIHQNPLSLPLVTKLEDYKYSSYQEYLTDEPSQLNKEEVINWFGNLEQFIINHQF
ncbi:transposase [Pedobacter insulae]|uniref:Transposase IS200 like n=1 Tax=Pedobacter insulae TaxID=414048 RepID=A0A1I2T5A7_9SPHI|nr:transposase [Pedobacter insulae]SFG57656.1 Transposase IS200 like [Pedobacter insulae]